VHDYVAARKNIQEPSNYFSELQNVVEVILKFPENILKFLKLTILSIFTLISIE